MFVKYIEVYSCYGQWCQRVTLHRNPASLVGLGGHEHSLELFIQPSDRGRCANRLSSPDKTEERICVVKVVKHRLLSRDLLPVVEVCNAIFRRSITSPQGVSFADIKLTSQGLKLFQEHLFHPFELFNNWLDFIKYVCGIAAVISSCCTNAENKKFPTDSTCWSSFSILKESYQLVLDHQVLQSCVCI